MLLTGTGKPAHGWLVIGPDATIVASDAAACHLLGVPGHGDLQGHAWTSLVSPTEVDPANGKISVASPMGVAVMNHGVGDEVVVNAPAGAITFRVLDVQG